MLVMSQELFFKAVVLVLLMIETVIFSFNSQNEIEITRQVLLCGYRVLFRRIMHPKGFLFVRKLFYE